MISLGQVVCLGVFWLIIDAENSLGNISHPVGILLRIYWESVSLVTLYTVLSFREDLFTFSKLKIYTVLSVAQVNGH